MIGQIRTLWMVVGIMLSFSLVSPAAAATQSLTILGANGAQGAMDPYTEYSRDNGATWHQAFLSGSHPWGFVPGTNSWLNINPSPFFGLNTTTLYRVRFNVPAGATNPTANIQIKADDVADISLNGVFVSRVVSQGSANADTAFANTIHPGMNEITIRLSDWGGWVGLNYRVDLTVQAAAPLGMVPAMQLPPMANAGADQNIFLTKTALLDGSASSDPNGDAIVSYTWAIDSAPAGSTAALSSTSGVNVSLTPDVPGTYTISLVVNDGYTNSAAATVNITATQNLPPIAAASGSPVTGQLPLSVSLDAGASRDPERSALTYSWDFGDPASASNSSTQSSASHTYNSAGTYTAIVTVTDDFGQTDQASVTIIVDAPNLPPTVAPTVSTSSGAAPLATQFAANASDVNPADVLSYSWDFGDGATSAVANPVHTYAVAGSYTATVTVSDGVNTPVSKSLIISVDSPLMISVSEAKVDYGKKGEMKGKISMKADFTYSALMVPSDVIRIVFDGITLLEAPFSRFRMEHSGKYEYEAENVEAKIDLNKMTIKVSRHKLLLTGIDVSNGIDVVIYSGVHSATDHFSPQVKVKNVHDSDDEKEMSHKREH